MSSLQKVFLSICIWQFVTAAWLGHWRVIDLIPGVVSSYVVTFLVFVFSTKDDIAAGCVLLLHGTIFVIEFLASI
ncbi:hypothetical protein SCLCIDRAFT_1207271 [Scleroderma citrinum Foug A]|uniref:Uncharacterized protein n=1 Tax=Scleroderma citrinum Foug A TaxID=1036808 RepID=A0A0C3A8G5_9AGAM|nr:hypothetical protein SCLCIDRAFT_1207271 [Scleroderma citrinum Foug A]